MSSYEKESPIIKQLSDKVGGFTVSIHYDRRLYKQDIKGSIVHAAMLCKQKIITLADRDAIQNGLIEIEEITKVSTRLAINKGAYKTNLNDMKNIIDKFGTYLDEKK